MVRVKSCVVAHKRKKKILKEAKGQWGFKSRRYKEAIKSVNRARVFSYRDRRVKKREFRNLWIIRISAACENAGLSYSRFIKGLELAKIEINRKVLADLAMNSVAAFNKLVDVAKQAIESSTSVVKTTKTAKA